MSNWYSKSGIRKSYYVRKRWRYCQRCGKQVKELQEALVELKDDDTGKLNKLWLKVCKNCLNLKEDKWKKVV